MRAVIAAPYAWLVVFFLLPFALVLTIAVGTNNPDAVPPVDLGFSFANFARLFTDRLYIDAWLSSLRIAAVSTLGTLLLGYPMAYAIARAPDSRRGLLLMLIVLPFWTSFLLRVYAWIGLLKHDGVINNILMSLGLIHQPLTLLQTDFAVYVGIVYSYLPFMILPLYANLEKHDGAQLEAAADLGARPFTAFLRVTLPQSVPGIIAGSLLVFIPAVGEYVVPSLLGRTDQLMIGRVLSDEFFENRDWPLASAVAILMLLLLVIPIMLFQRSGGRQIGSHR